MGILANIYRHVEDNGKTVDCTNKGWSRDCNTVCIVNADGPFDPSPSHIAVKLVKHPMVNHVYAVSVEHDEAGKWTQMGGNFVRSSDSRFTQLVRDLLGDNNAFVGAVPIHDRIEE